MNESTNYDFDPLESSSNVGSPKPTTNTEATELAYKLQIKQDAFREVADRFYMLWWNMPEMSHRNIDRDLVDLFRKFMDLAPSMGVSRNSIPEPRECCGRKRSPLPGDFDPNKAITGAHGVVSPYYENLGWCPGDIIRRITRFFGAGYCERCDRRRQAINAFFRCGKK